MRTNVIEAQTKYRDAAQQVCIDSRVSTDCATHDTIVIMLIGAIIGWALGMSYMIFLGAWSLFYLELMPLLPFASAFGWAMIGMIVGGSGLFSKVPPSGSDVETPAELVHRKAA